MLKIGFPQELPIPPSTGSPAAVARNHSNPSEVPGIVHRVRPALPGQSRDKAILQVIHRAARRLEAQREFTDVGNRPP